MPEIHGHLICHPQHRKGKLVLKVHNKSVGNSNSM